MSNAPGPAPHRSPETPAQTPDPVRAGMDGRVLAGIGAALREHLGAEPDDLFPGAVVLVERRGTVAFRGAWGLAQTHGDGAPRAMETGSIFDLASLTKVCVTAPLLMRLVEAGEVDIHAPVGSFLAGFGGPGKDGVLVHDLLTHRAGLWEWWPLYVEARSRAEAFAAAAKLPLRYEPRAERHYSDIGLILAGAIVEIVANARVDELAREWTFDPLGMNDTSFLPPARWRERVVATSTADAHERAMLATGVPYPTTRSPDDFDGWREHTLLGEAEDGNAHHAFEGVAPHAGLFSTADDVARLGRAFLDALSGKDSWIAPDVARLFGLGGDEGEPLIFFGDRRAEVGLGHGGLGHSGFTGTQMFIEPESDLVVVLLSNRTHRTRLPYPSILPAWRDVLRIAQRSFLL